MAAAAPMHTYVITRCLKGVGAKPETELCGMAKVSVESMESLRKQGKDIEWEASYPCGDECRCIYRAKDTATLDEHAKMLKAAGIDHTWRIEGPVPMVVNPACATKA